jgi:hypothetical protein
MKQWLTILAVVGSLILPVVVSADKDDPAGGSWSSTSSTPKQSTVPEKRVVTTEQGQATDSPRPAAMRPTGPLYLTEEDAKYQSVNDTAKD